MGHESNLMSVDEAAAYVRLSKGAMAQRRYLGLEPAWVKLGKSVFYSKSRLDEWIANSERTTIAA
jgi:predicted DNA-binding transcriptional regulator AlpA